MQFISLSKLNTSHGASLRRIVSGQACGQRILVSHLWFEAQIPYYQRGSSLGYRTTSSVCGNLLIHKYLVDPTITSRSCSLQRKPMAASGSQTVSGDVHVDSLIVSCGNVQDLAKPSAVFFGDRSVGSFRKASISLRNRDAPLIQLAFPYVSRRTWDSRLLVKASLRSLRTASSASFSNDAAADVPFDISGRNDRIENSMDSNGCKNVGQKTLKLHSGSCYLPHPDKVITGGEDAHFICEEEKVIGVADGVGGWADVGVDAGEYARQLMSNSVTAIQDEPKVLVDPAKVLEKAHAGTKVMGSSTACIVALTDMGIHAVNLGDSGFIVIRDGSTVFRSPAQQYGFNFPYQLASGTGGDLPSSGQVFTFPVASGDVIVAGTDGLFDNLYDNEIATLVVQAMRTGQEPQVTAQNIASLAQRRGQDRHRQTPFSSAAHDAGFRYVGGKLDDVTVVVSYVTDTDNHVEFHEYLGNYLNFVAEQWKTKLNFTCTDIEDRVSMKKNREKQRIEHQIDELEM